MIKIEINIKDLKVNYIKKGEGKNVLILPGWGTQISTYNTLIESIATYATVYCIDMPGFGKTSEPKTPWKLNDYVELVTEFIKAMNIKELDLIGHSNGGRIIIRLMNQKLNFKVNKIILIGSAGIVHKKTFKQNLRIKTFKLGKKVLQIGLIKKLFPNALEKLQSKFGSADYKSATPIMRNTMVSLVNEDLKDELANVNVPTLLLWGENDTQTPIQDGELMEKLIPDAGLVKFDGCTHYVFLERAVQINKIIYTFLK